MYQLMIVHCRHYTTMSSVRCEYPVTCKRDKMKYTGFYRNYERRWRKGGVRLVTSSLLLYYSSFIIAMMIGTRCYKQALTRCHEKPLGALGSPSRTSLRATMTYNLHDLPHHSSSPPDLSLSACLAAGWEREELDRERASEAHRWKGEKFTAQIVT